ncbi:hypothetical protein SAMD00023353_1100050 [Rosellinia necatrix]|uniref:Cupin-type protein n=1 Tax=Rosellinia necatrix TaxID=77044 RepID=A0A1S7UR44_ROSNE|nr:hypothetical protein SAMD00023353_1100050 [Rosellinia necatrix]
MSGANSWLQRQRKTDLAELAHYTGLKQFDSLKKVELELALDEYLAENAATFQLDPKLAPYYASRARTIGSPIKKDVDAPVEKAKAPRRRTTKVEEPTEPTELTAPIAPIAPIVPIESSEEEQEPSGTSTAVARTPSRALSLASRIPLPATPADVAEAVDRSAVAVRTRVAAVYRESGITEATRATRETLSTVGAVLLAVSAFEMYFLRPELLADRYAFTIPAIPLLGTGDHPVFVPDMFLLLTASFWSPALLWAFTSAALPSLAGYFVNLTAAPHHTSSGGGRVVTRRSAPTPTATPEAVVDPLTFSIVKALISFVVYGQGVTFGGWINAASIARINSAVYGGYKGVLAGAAISGIFSIYDAVLKK